MDIAAKAILTAVLFVCLIGLWAPRPRHVTHWFFVRDDSGKPIFVAVQRDYLTGKQGVYLSAVDDVRALRPSIVWYPGSDPKWLTAEELDARKHSVIFNKQP